MTQVCESVFGWVCDSFSVEILTPNYRLRMAWLFNRWYHAINPNYLQNPFLQPIQLNIWFRPGREQAIDCWGVDEEKLTSIPITNSKAPDKDFQMTLTSFNSLRPWWHTPPTPSYRPICAFLRNMKEQFVPAIENTKHRMRKTLNTSIDHCRPIRPWRVKVSDVNQTHIAVSVVGMIRNHENQLALSWPWH